MSPVNDLRFCGRPARSLGMRTLRRTCFRARSCGSFRTGRRSVSPVPPEGHLTGSATKGQNVRVASASITLPAASLMPLNSKQPDWSLQLASFVMSFAKSKANGRQNRREDLFFAGAVAGAIFLAVSSAVAMTQRRRKSKAKLAAFR